MRYDRNLDTGIHPASTDEQNIRNKFLHAASVTICMYFLTCVANHFGDFRSQAFNHNIPVVSGGAVISDRVRATVDFS
jgi:hypothetical protein